MDCYIDEYIDEIRTLVFNPRKKRRLSRAGRFAVAIGALSMIFAGGVGLGILGCYSYSATYAVVEDYLKPAAVAPREQAGSVPDQPPLHRPSVAEERPVAAQETPEPVSLPPASSAPEAAEELSSAPEAAEEPDSALEEAEELISALEEAEVPEPAPPVRRRGTPRRRARHVTGAGTGHLRILCAEPFRAVVDGVERKTMRPIALRPGVHRVRVRYLRRDQDSEARSVRVRRGKTTVQFFVPNG